MRPGCRGPGAAIQHCSDESCAYAVLVLGISAASIISRDSLGPKPGCRGRYYRRGSIVHRPGPRRSTSSTNPGYSTTPPPATRTSPDRCHDPFIPGVTRPATALAQVLVRQLTHPPPTAGFAPRARCHLAVSLPKPGFRGWQAQSATTLRPLWPLPIPSCPARLPVARKSQSTNSPSLRL